MQLNFDERDSLSGRRLIRGKFPVRSDSFLRQIEHHLAGISCKRELCASISPPAYRNSNDRRMISVTAFTTARRPGQGGYSLYPGCSHVRGSVMVLGVSVS
jgi:hypothetical protein